MPVWLQVIMLSLATLCIVLSIVLGRVLAREEGWEKAILCGLMIAGPGVGIWSGFLLAWYGAP